ncbi:MAG TPA: ArsA family ATPase, partial [Gemmatimonadaceae bacterium]|nr:ArsA family ATPase [Gemmatimonadaceae bacterium]
MTGVDALLASLPPWTLVGGKGGVGKTTCAAALALHSARRGCRTLVLSTDPAGALGDVLGTSLTGEPRALDAGTALSAAQLDAHAARTRFLGEWGDVIATIIDRGTYLDREDIDGLVAAAMPGIDETMALLALAELADAGTWGRVFLDSAPTGHTLRLLALPQTFHAVIDLLDTMQAKHRFMVSALMRRYRSDEADAFLSEMRRKVERLRQLLSDAARTGVVLVTRPEPVVVSETERYAIALGELGLHVRVVLVNAVGHDRSGAAVDAAEQIRGASRGAITFAAPELAGLAGGEDDLSRWAAGVRQLRPRPPARATAPRGPRTARGRATRPRRRDLASLPHAGPFVESLPPVLVVGGKGGVGKTTVSCALALAAARSGARTFL